MKRIAFCASLLLCAVGASGQPWIPVECSSISREARAAFAQSMTAAKPGAPNYAPKPFPRNQEEIIENFKYIFLEIGKKGEAPDDLSRLVQAVEAGALDFRILRVENWTPDRCDPDQQRDFFYLLYVKSAQTGQELSRFVLNQNGMASQWTIAPTKEDEGEPWVAPYRAAVAPQLPDALAEVRARFGIEGSRAQYVATWGQPECPAVSPCIAFIAKGNYYLYRAGTLVEISSGSRSYPRADVNVSRQRYSEIVGTLDPAQEWFVSVADRGWVVATRVKPVR